MNVCEYYIIVKNPNIAPLRVSLNRIRLIILLYYLKVNKVISTTLLTVITITIFTVLLILCKYGFGLILQFPSVICSFLNPLTLNNR